MRPCAFTEANATADTPTGADPLVIEPMRVCRVAFPGGGRAIVSCWKPTADELAEILRTGRVWLTIFGDIQPLVSIDGFSPFGTAASPPA